MITLAIWLFLSPWILEFAALSTALWNHVILGLLIVALAPWELGDLHHHPIRRQVA